MEMTMSIPNSSVCSASTRQANAPLYGTAPQVGVWLLLEYPQAWAKNATAKADLPAEVNAWFLQLLSTLPNARWQFIKQMERETLTDLTLYIAVTTPTQPRLYRLTLPTLAAVLAVDVLALVNDTAGAAAARTAEKLILVCTNGEHDPCCGQYGQALYGALQAQKEIAVWQTTHIAGHRYAATLVTFPDGVYYGQVTSADVLALVAALQADEVYLPKLRGRCAYEEAAQAGEYFLRTQTGKLAQAAYQLQAQTANGACTTLTWAGADGEVISITVERGLAPFTLVTSCDKPEPARIPIFRQVIG
jgi:hypothetical protein